MASTEHPLHSLGLGLATKNRDGDIIEVYYPQPLLSPATAVVDAVTECTGADTRSNTVQEISISQCKDLARALESSAPALAAAAHGLADSEQIVVLCSLAEDKAPTTVAEAFLKLHLLSHRLARPNSLNLDGMFAVLHNLAWTNEGPVDLTELGERQLRARRRGGVLDVQSVDKFPKMTNYVVPSGVRIADTARVRLGAYIGEGTTVMHEGFVNFNAGTLGTAMIEGRISAGVVVGNNSDLGGSSSTMGTLSGGGKEVISVGENCLIGANAGVGISLANGCVVEAGLYVTAGTKVRLLDSKGDSVRVAKAVELMRLENHVYRRNSLTGAVECVPLKNQVSLNEELHSHN